MSGTGPGAQDSHPSEEDKIEQGPSRTLEHEVQTRLMAGLGGPRGAIEAAVPIAAFTLAYVIIGDLVMAVAVGGSAAAVALSLRLVQRSAIRHALNGAAGIGLGALFALGTGSAENAFVPGIAENALWAAVLAGSMVIRPPLAGHVLGVVLADVSSWHRRPEALRLAYRLTLILALPPAFRLFAEVPLYMGEHTGWLGFTRVALGWPLHLAALGAVGVILATGRTRLEPAERD